jgi:hypothetical protein
MSGANDSSGGRAGWPDHPGRFAIPFFGIIAILISLWGCGDGDDRFLGGIRVRRKGEGRGAGQDPPSSLKLRPVSCFRFLGFGVVSDRYR